MPKLDKIIAQQEEIILNQRMQLAKQDTLLAQSKKQHEEADESNSNLEENQQNAKRLPCHDRSQHTDNQLFRYRRLHQQVYLKEMSPVVKADHDIPSRK